jgi:hypothetical protein
MGKTRYPNGLITPYRIRYVGRRGPNKEGEMKHPLGRLNKKQLIDLIEFYVYYVRKIHTEAHDQFMKDKRHRRHP